MCKYLKHEQYWPRSVHAWADIYMDKKSSSELKSFICHSHEWQMGIFSSNETNIVLFNQRNMVILELNSRIYGSRSDTQL